MTVINGCEQVIVGINDLNLPSLGYKDHRRRLWLY